MPTRNEKIEFIRDVLRQARVRECIGKVCEECKFYDTPNCLETCYATELVDMGIVQLPAEKQNAPEAKTIDLSDKKVSSPIGPAALKEMPNESLADIVKVVTSSVETYVKWRLEVFTKALKERARSFLMRDTSDGQYYSEQYVPVATIDHILMLLTDGNDEQEVPYDYRLDT